MSYRFLYLRCIEGSSDKFYELRALEYADGYRVVALNGRMHTEGTMRLKTGVVAEAVALSEIQNLASEKIRKKGYWVSDEGFIECAVVPITGNGLGPRVEAARAPTRQSDAADGRKQRAASVATPVADQGSLASGLTVDSLIL